MDLNKRFVSALKNSTPTHEIFAPGRVNLIGEHTDYNGGKVMPCALGIGIKIECRQGDFNDWNSLSESPNSPIFVFNSEFSGDPFSVSLKELKDVFPSIAQHMEVSSPQNVPEKFKKSWARYVLGCLVQFLSLPTVAKRLDVTPSVHIFSIESTLPVGAGLSSSAALCTGLLSAFSFHFGVHISAKEIAHLAMTVEHYFAGTKCGMMDQLAIVSSQQNHFTCIDFVDLPKNGTYSIEKVGAHKNLFDYSLMIFNTSISHSLADSEYNRRRESCENALTLLNAHSGMHKKSLGEYSEKESFTKLFLKPVSESQQECVSRMKDIFLNSEPKHAEMLAKRAAHAIFENFRVDAAKLALKTGDLVKLDRVMRESHQSLRDDYEVSCLELNAACDEVTKTAEKLGKLQMLDCLPVIGCRMTGGGFGGSTVQFVHNSIAKELLAAFSQPDNPYTQQTGKAPQLLITTPHDGIRAAIL